MTPIVSSSVDHAHLEWLIFSWNETHHDIETLHHPFCGKNTDHHCKVEELAALAKDFIVEDWKLECEDSLVEPHSHGTHHSFIQSINQSIDRSNRSLQVI